MTKHKMKTFGISILFFFKLYKQTHCEKVPQDLSFCLTLNSHRLSLSDFLWVSLIAGGLQPPEKSICLPVAMPTAWDFPLSFPVFPAMWELHASPPREEVATSNYIWLFSSPFVRGKKTGNEIVIWKLEYDFHSVLFPSFS